MKTLPKKIHFIWVGGDLRDDYLEKIIELSSLAKKSGFEFNLWVDNEKNFNNALKKHKFTKGDLNLEISSKTLGIKLRNIDELISVMENDPFYQVDNRLEGFMHGATREMVGSKNLAAAADWLRYEILRQEGGYYFDMDSRFEFEKDSILIPDETLLGLKTYYSIGTKDLNNISGGNDMIGAIPHHQVIENTILYAINYYKKLDQQNELKDFMESFLKRPMNINDLIKQYEDFLSHKININTTSMDVKRFPYAEVNVDLQSRRFNETINASGPGAFAQGIKKFIIDNNLSKEEILSLGTDGIYKPMGIQFYSNSRQSWLNKGTPITMKGLSYDDQSLTSSEWLKQAELIQQKSKMHKTERRQIVYLISLESKLNEPEFKNATGQKIMIQMKEVLNDNSLSAKEKILLIIEIAEKKLALINTKSTRLFQNNELIANLCKKILKDLRAEDGFVKSPIDLAAEERDEVELAKNKPNNPKI